jgi:hypothetical protein
MVQYKEFMLAKIWSVAFLFCFSLSHTGAPVDFYTKRTRHAGRFHLFLSLLVHARLDMSGYSVR